MSQATLVYRHAVNPSRGLAATGIIVVKLFLVLPHLIIASALFIVLFTGSLPVGIQHLAAGSMQWTLRVYAFLAGITDDYPKFSLQVTPEV
ncbi:MAG: DUF4389 domain-containing protein [Actinomycetota bacterium]